jgi:hypothetical protein
MFGAPKIAILLGLAVCVLGVELTLLVRGVFWDTDGDRPVASESRVLNDDGPPRPPHPADAILSDATPSDGAPSSAGAAADEIAQPKSPTIGSDGPSAADKIMDGGAQRPVFESRSADTQGDAPNIADTEAAVESRVQAQREEIAQRATAEYYLEGAQSPAPADEPKSAIAVGSAQVEVEKPPPPAAAEKLAAEEAEQNAAIASAEAQLDDRQHSARQSTAELATADLDRARSEEADRIVADLDSALQAAEAAAA